MAVIFLSRVRIEKQERKNIKIAICDDMQAQRALLEKYITEWGKKTGQDVQIAVFASSEEFLFHWEEDMSFDLLSRH